MRDAVQQAEAGVRFAIDLVKGRWTIPILLRLCVQPTHFGELQREVGLSARVRDHCEQRVGPLTAARHRGHQPGAAVRFRGPRRRRRGSRPRVAGARLEPAAAATRAIRVRLAICISGIALWQFRL